MSNIRELRPPQVPVSHILELLNDIKDDIECVCVVITTKDGSVQPSWSDATDSHVVWCGEILKEAAMNRSRV